MNKTVSSIALLAVFIVTLQVYAELTPAPVFNDHMVLQRDMIVPVWGKADPAAEITISINQINQSTTASDSGNWTMELPAMPAGGPYQMTISDSSTTITYGDIYIGDVWLCSGQSNMDMTVAMGNQYWCGVDNADQEVANADYPLIRVFDVPFVTSEYPLDSVTCEWMICSPQTAGSFSAAAYFMARDLYLKYNIPIGLITSAFGASTAESWTSRESLIAHPQLRFLIENYAEKKEAYDADPERQRKYKENLAKWQSACQKAEEEGKLLPRGVKIEDPRDDQHSPYTCYNGMIAPLIPYAIKGTIWYQGESNQPTSKLYDVIMENMIADWRNRWQQGDFPFIYVQLANYGKESDNPNKPSPFAEVRYAQLQNLQIANTAMATAIDIGDAGNIHPKNKQEVGRRLALCADALAYDQPTEYMGPIYKEMKVEGNKAIISFDHIGSGLAVHGEKLEGFAIAGRNNEYIWADAQIVGDTVVVSSEKVKNPISVRYAYADNPKCSLYNKEGLPASPFAAY